MVTYTVRQAAYYFEGRVASVSVPFLLRPGGQPLFSVSVTPAAGYAAAAVNALGVPNPLGLIECSVRIKSSVLDAPGLADRLNGLVGKPVRIAGAWCDMYETGGASVAAIYPLGLLVTTSPLEVYDIDGWPVAVRDYDVIAFAHLGPPDEPFAEESRTLGFTVPFPSRPSHRSEPFWRFYDDPIVDEVVRHDAVIVAAQGAGSHMLSLTVETGAPEDGKGALIGQLGLSYDEPDLDDFCPPGTCEHDGKWCSHEGDFRYMRVAPHVPYAQPGDLALSPGDGKGLISGIVAATDPPQIYDHMGLFIDNGRTIRHCTASADRAEAEDLFTQQFTINFGGEIPVHTERVPLGGLRADILRYGWPGTITQTVEEVYKSGRNTLNARWGYEARHPGEGLTDPLDPAKPFRVYQVAPAARGVRLLFIDPERRTQDGKDVTERITRLQDTPTYVPVRDRPEQPLRRWDPWLVKPQPQVEAEVRPSLLGVVAAAKKIDAHYRFFAYTQGDIGLRPEFTAPPAGEPQWGSRQGADWGAGTIPAMCSSFVWTAVQHANDARPVGTKPIILEDRRDSENPDTGLEYGARDGFYRYDATERAKAAGSLVTYLRTKITDKFNAKIPGIVYTFTHGLEDVRDTTAANVANQTANVFAFDRPDDFSEAWRTPGNGDTVGPEHTATFWDIKPVDGVLRHPEGGLGVYGQVIPLMLTSPRWSRVPLFRKRDDDPGRGRARFFVFLNGALVAGATVRIDFGCYACVSTTDRELAAHLDLEAGRHFAETFFVMANPVTGNMETFRTTAPVEFTVTAGASVDVSLALSPPDDLWRVIDVVLEADIHDRSFWGGDSDQKFLRLTPSFELRQDLSDPADAADDERNTVLSFEGYWQTEPEVGSGVHVGLTIQAKFDPADRSVTVHCRTALFDTSSGGIFGLFTDYEVDQVDEQTRRIVADATLPLLASADFASDETVPERATVTVSITNRRRSS